MHVYILLRITEKSRPIAEAQAFLCVCLTSILALCTRHYSVEKRRMIFHPLLLLLIAAILRSCSLREGGCCCMVEVYRAIPCSQFMPIFQNLSESWPRTTSIICKNPPSCDLWRQVFHACIFSDDGFYNASYATSITKKSLSMYLQYSMRQPDAQKLQAFLFDLLFFCFILWYYLKRRIKNLSHLSAGSSRTQTSRRHNIYILLLLFSSKKLLQLLLACGQQHRELICTWTWISRRLCVFS